MEHSDDLAAFVLARVAEDEVIARGAIEDDCSETEGLANQYEWLTGRSPRVNSPRFGDALAQLAVTFAIPARVLVECAARRRTVDDFLEADRVYRDAPTEFGQGRRFAALMAVCRLAEARADHPDYREEWKP